MAQDYEALGVSATKPEVHAAIADQDPGLNPGAFCQTFPDLAGDPKYCSILHADGAGTKSTLAYLSHQETGDPTVYDGIARDSLAMNLDDMACNGVTREFFVSNTIGRNAHRIGGDVLRHVVKGYSDFRDRMAPYGIDITLAGGETADVGDLVGTVIVDSTVIARIKRSEVIDCSNIQPGNAIVGLASFGQAVYEDKPNSGIGSNGLTLARHALLSNIYAEKYPETYSSTLRPDQVYTGPYKLDDELPGSAQTIGEALLSPTRTYLPVAKAVLEHCGVEVITGIIHSSGGGQAKCRKFGENLHYVKDNLFPAPPIFRAIEQAGGISPKEMFGTFNMGTRLELYCDSTVADEIIDISRTYGVDAQVIGHVEANSRGNKVTITDSAGTYTYE